MMPTTPLEASRLTEDDRLTVDQLVRNIDAKIAEEYTALTPSVGYLVTDQVSLQVLGEIEQIYLNKGLKMDREYLPNRYYTLTFTPR
jgi:hypothetical protein